MNRRRRSRSSWRTRPPLLSARARAGVLGGLIAIVGGGCVGIVEPPPPPNTSAGLTETVHLTAERPVAIRHLTFEVAPPARTLTVSLDVDAHRVVDNTTVEFADGVTVSVRSDDAGTAAYSGGSRNADPGAIFSLTKLCGGGCRSGATVVVRGTSDTRPTEDIEFSGLLYASGMTSDQDPLGTTLTIQDDDAAGYDGALTTVTSSVSSVVSLSPASPTAHVDLHLRADPSVLTAPVAFPLLGSVTLTATGDAATHDEVWSVLGNAVGVVTVDGQQTGIGAESGAYDIDWLRLCTGGARCEVDLGIDFEYDRLRSSARVNAALRNETAVPPPPAYRLTLEAVARLEAFDGRDLPAEGLTLTAD